MNNILIPIFQLAVFLFSVMLHEISHGLMALRLGDDTAKSAGRLTLNPLKHLDPFGSIFLPLILFLTNSSVILGWAKPVPYNPNALYKDFKYGPLKVALAGPISNLAIAAAFGLVVRLGAGFLNPIMLAMLSLIVFLNCLLAVFNLIPIPPLDGSKVLAAILPYKYSQILQNVGLGGVFFLMLFVYLFPNIIWVPSFSIFQALVGIGGLNAFLGVFGG
ncbi:MAG: site-2 protease family protein [Candidatus Colwellbacteria bacterium]|nr:site-2 protease family protein [Candidatus Colwellbacteria bacterium]MBI3274286.1 site-2 protease family protein [Candidatus Colwellbacteria bacterium]